MHESKSSKLEHEQEGESLDSNIEQEIQRLEKSKQDFVDL